MGRRKYLRLVFCEIRFLTTSEIIPFCCKLLRQITIFLTAYSSSRTCHPMFYLLTITTELFVFITWIFTLQLFSFYYKKIATISFFLLLIGKTLFLVLHVSEQECTARLSTLILKALGPSVCLVLYAAYLRTPTPTFASNTMFRSCTFWSITSWQEKQEWEGKKRKTQALKHLGLPSY